ncbi:MAG: inositol 2-dehydrogenase [Chlamydiia bacterium]|nr:inositol 2-dehydrogenase [Chlamydiia bacterium]
MKVCVIGCGKMGAVHAENVAQHSSLILHSVVDPNLGLAQQLASRFGVVAASNAEEALKSSDVDAVIIASSSDTHATLIEQAARRGKAILCEKPIGTNMEEIQHVAQVIKETGVPFMLGFNRRFDPRFSAVHSSLSAGKIGAPEMVCITSRDALPPPLGYVKVSGGIFRDMTIHDFDMARWMLGEAPSEVFATGSCLVNQDFATVGDSDTAMVVLKTPSGRLCQINNSRRSTVGYDQRVEVFGSQGVLKSEDVPAHVNMGGMKARPGDHFCHIYNRYQQSYQAELDHFVACVENASRPLVGIEDGILALKIANAAQQSKEEGRPVAIAY